MARPSIKLDWDKIGKEAECWNTHKDIAYLNNCSVDYLEDQCVKVQGMSLADFCDKKKSGTRNRLLRTMIAKAEKGDTTMLIWLSKNMLGMSDKVESKEEVTVREKIYKAEWGNAQEQTDKDKKE